MLRSVAFLLALLAWPLAAFGQAELIVRLEDGADASLVRALEERAGVPSGLPAPQLRLADPTQAVLFDGVQGARAVFAQEGSGAGTEIRAYTLRTADAAAFERLRARWAAAPGVRYAQPNHAYTLDGFSERWTESIGGQRSAVSGRSDPLLDSLSHLDVIRAREAWAITTGEPGVRVGVIDTGFFLEHPDLAGQFWVNPGEDLNGNGRVDPSDFNGEDDDQNGYVDDLKGYDFVDRPEEVRPGDFSQPDPDASADPETGSGHGTAVAGILGAALGNGEGIAGVAPGVRLVPLRAFGGDGRGYDSDIAAAIVYAAEMGLDVVNLSFGDVYFSPIMEEAIAYAVSRGVVVVASAGNSANNEPHYPSDYEDVISVAWLNAGGERGAVSFAGFGPGVDLGAPGSGIFTTLLPRDFSAAAEADLYGFYGAGSSYAAPMVAGAAALLRSLDGSLSPASIRSILVSSAVDIEGEGWDQRTGGGRLDVASALAQALPGRVEILSPENDGGAAPGRVPVVGTAVNPAFESFSVYYAAGYDEEAWTRIAGPAGRQIWQDTLAVWEAENLPDTTYTLRLAVKLRTGGTVEKQQRFYLDGTAPEIDLRFLQSGLVEGRPGVVADLSTDDLTQVVLRIRRGGRTETVRSDRRARRHGLAWSPGEGGTGGLFQVEVVATNASGLVTTLERSVDVPPDRANTALFASESTGIPYGYLLPEATDFDGDGLLELTLNRFGKGGALGDTIATYEWAENSFQEAHALSSNTFPRDVGDTDGDGRQELLTSVRQGTFLIAAPSAGAYPGAEAFRSTTLGGALLDDLDGDGRGAIIGHEDATEWVVLENQGGRFVETARLENPTGVQPGAPVAPNDFERLEALAGDFDGDGRRGLLVGDLDGDWILYESTGTGDAFRVAWTYETARYNAGARFAQGDFDGDGTEEFVTYTDPFKGNLRPLEGVRFEQEPPIGLYYFWDASGDDTYELVETLPIAGSLSTDGALAAADVDGDGRDELALVHPPYLYLLSYDAADGWQVRYRHRGARSRALTTADFDADGRPEIIASDGAGRLQRFVFRPDAARTPPPRWVEAVALGPAQVRLRWRAPGADSVVVFSGPPEAGTLDRIGAAQGDSSFVAATGEVRRYVLRAWEAGRASPFSEPRVVRPRAPATVAEIAYPDTNAVKLVFTEALAPSTRAEQFALEEAGAPEVLLLAENGRAAVLRFERVPAGRGGVLRWTGVRDAGGLPVGQTEAEVRFPASEEGTLIVAGWAVPDAQTVTLTFSAPLDASSAEDPANYRLRPAGRIAAVERSAEDPARVTVRIAGVRLGATGRDDALTVLRMRSADGQTLAPEGWAVRLARPAESLAGVYVYPNPHHAGRHGGPVRVAGLPAGARVEIVSVQGTLVHEIESAEVGRNGGAAWDLTDRQGRRVPPGVYLVRVEAPDEAPVLKKVAVIR